MNTEIIHLVNEIDCIVRKELWFDFHVVSYNRSRLTIAGSTDLSYYHKLEVIFEDVFFASIFFGGWHTNTSSTVFKLPDNQTELNAQYEIERGYQLFVFEAEDYQNNVVIAANKLSYNTDTVFYYDREDLKENERIAEFVKRG